MAKQARRHHHIPECYLKWFTTKNGKKKQLAVASIRDYRYFETIPLNVANIRDFNRIDIPGFAPDALEGMLSKFESEVAVAIQDVSQTLRFEGDQRNAILNLMALLAVRSPQQRESWRRARAHSAKVALSMALHSKESWEFYKRKLIADGQEIDDSISYEAIRDSVSRNAYFISLANEEHIRREIMQHDVVLRYLSLRTWRLLTTDEGNGHFITGDRPFLISWRDIHEVPLMHRNSPGVGMPNTEVYFPLTKNLALVGIFDGNDAVERAENTMVASLNIQVIRRAHEQVYAAKRSFPYIGPDGQYYFDLKFMDRYKTQHEADQAAQPSGARPA